MGKLSVSDRVALRSMYEVEGLSCEMIASHFGVSRVAIWKQLRGMGVDTSKGGVNINRLVSCSNCGVEHIKKRAYWRARKLGRYFCSKLCYLDWLKWQGSDYKVSRYGQRAARRKLLDILGELPDGAVVHHINGDCLDNFIENLMLFSSHSDHMKWHRGDRDGVVPLWDGQATSLR